MKQNLPKWTGLCLVLLQLFAFSTLFAQQHAKTTVVGAVSTTIALGSTAGLHTQLVYDNADFGIRPGSGNITRLWFRRNGTDQVTLTNLVIRLGQTSSTSDYVSGGAFLTGLSQVYSATGWTVPAGVANAWFAIDLTTPFSYDPSQRLIVDITFGSSSNTGFAVVASSTSTFKKLFSASATATTGSTSSVWPDFGLSFAAPSNDLCSGATSLIPSRNCGFTLSGNTMGATAGFSTTPCSGFFSSNPDDDVWYSFVAHGQGDTITVTGIGAFDPVVEAFANCGTVTSPTRIACADASTTGGTETLILPSLTAGATYRIRVFSYDAFRGNFTICLRNRNAITNDECENAIPLSASTFCNSLSANNFGATQSLSPSTCNTFTSSTANDVWFSFVAFNESDSIIVNGLGVLDAVVEIRDGCSGASVACTDEAGVNFEYLQPGNLVPGRTYKVRVYGWNGGQGNFTICHVYHGIPSNDDCANPVQLEVGTACNYLFRNTFQASNSSSFPPCAGLNPDDDVWFSFVAPSPSVQANVTQTFFSGTAFFLFDAAVEVYAACNPSSILQCVNTSPIGSNPEVLNLTGLTPGQTYLIRVYNSGNNSGNVGFGICLLDAFCEPKVGAAGINPSNRDIVSNGSVQVGVTFHQGDLVWESSTDGINFTPDPTKTADTVVFIPKTASGGMYYFRARVSDGICDPVYSDTLSIPVRCHSPFSQTLLGDLSYITAINVGSFTKVSSFDPKGGAYQDFRDDTIRVCLSNTRTKTAVMKMDMNQANTSVRRMVWVDFNQNGVFGDVAGEFVHVGNGIQAQTVDMPLALSGAVQEGNYTMRIAALANIDGSVIFPCFQPTFIGFGEIEEYTLQIRFEPVPNAGPDEVTCSNQALLVGNGIPAGNTGQWSVLSGPGFSGEGNILNPNDSSSLVSNLKPGLNGFIWTLSGPCGTFSDTVLVQYIPVVPNAGVDQVVCTTTVVMAANPVPAQTFGSWSVIEGAGYFNDFSSPTTLVFNPATGVNRYVWTFDPSFCDPVSDTVTVIVREEPTPAFAGNDTTVCLGSVFRMRANTPLVGTGTWTRISGTATVVNPSNPTSLLANLSSGTHRFRWTISNPPCADSFDEVVIDVVPPPVPDAGNDTVVCGTSFGLNANPAPNQTVTGFWTVAEGSGYINASLDPNTAISDASVGVNKYVWNFQSNFCDPVSDTVTVIVREEPTPAFAGNDTTVCLGSVFRMRANTALVGTGIWTRISGTATVVNPSNPTSLLANLSAGTHRFRWTISNPPCADSFDEVVIDVVAPPVPDAGNDTVVCGTSFGLHANPAPNQTVTGFWTVAEGSGYINASLDPNTTISDASVGVNKYVWNFQSNFCDPVSDTVTVIVREEPTPAFAGNDTSLCASSSFRLSGNLPLVGTGIWTRINGTGTIVNPSNPSSLVTGLTPGVHTFRWTISNPPCADSFDEVRIIVVQPNTAIAGSDQTICKDTIQLSGNDPDLDGVTSSWTQIGGNAFIQNPNSATTLAFGLSTGLNRFEYAINTPGCPVSKDTVTITRKVQPSVPNPGLDRILCNGSVQLAATTPASGSGLWTLVSGGGTIQNPTSPTSQVTNMPAGANQFRWTLSDAPCASVSSVVTMTVLLPIPAIAGQDQTICTTSVALSGNPVSGTGVNSNWSVLEGSGSIAGNGNGPNAFVVNLSPGLNRFVYTVNVGACHTSKDTVSVQVQTPQTAQAGADQFVFQNSTLLTGSPAGGTWTRVSGSGTVQNPGQASTNVTGIGLGSSSFEYILSQAPCPTSRDTVVITRNPIPNVCQGILFQVNPDGGASASVQLDVVGNFSFQSHKLLLGDGSQLEGSGDTFTGSHTYPAPGLYNACARLFYTNVLNQPDSCEICDTVRIPEPVSPCSTAGLNTSYVGTGFDVQSSFSGSSQFQSWELTMGDGNQYSGSGNYGFVSHTYAQPGTYNTCLRYIYTDAFQQQDTCLVCDTVFVPTPVSPCGTASITTTYTGSGFDVQTNFSGSSQFQSWEVSMGDGTQVSGTGSAGFVSHSYSNPGTYNTCIRYFFTNAFQLPDTCEVCDTVLIPEPFNPCTSFGLVRLQTDTLQVTEPDSIMGRYYTLNDSVFFTPGSFTKVTVKVARSAIDAPELTGSLVPAGSAAFLEFNLTLKPGQNYVCYTGHFLNSLQEMDSCVVCTTQVLAYPPACDLFALEKKQICRNSYQAKARFSTQSVFDSVWVRLDDDNDQAFYIAKSGDSIVFEGITPGKHRICALAIRKNDPDKLDLPGFTCAACDSITIAPGPDAGIDVTLCADSISRMSSSVPADYVARWERISGSSVLDVSNPAELRAGQLSVGENRFALVFFKNDQTCPEEADTFIVNRVVPILADAGPDQTTTLSSVNLAAGNPAGTWTKISGTGLIADPASPTTSVSGLTPGSHQFVWTVESLPCPSSSDTVTIFVNDACQGITISARHTQGYFGQIVLKGPDLVQPVSSELDFGDGIIINLSDDTLSHLYPGSGTFNACVKFRYLHPNQSLDSCIVCDTISIPEFQSPCGTFGFTASVLTSDIPFGAPNQPDSLVGRYYDYGVDLTKLGNTISGTQFSFDGGNWLNVSNYGPHDSAFAYVIGPKEGNRQLCVRGFFTGPDGKQDTCVVCQTFQNPFPEACTQLKLEYRQECRNQVVVKARFSQQGRFDSVYVAIDTVLYPIARSGDSIVVQLSAGSHSICALSRIDQNIGGRPIGLDLPGFDCQHCDTLEIAPGPDAGSDVALCGDSIQRETSSVPAGYVSRWEKVSGDAVLDGSSSSTLRAGQLSFGENRFALVFFKNDQTCPEEADTFSVFRETPPVADAGNDRFICADTLTLRGFGGNGTWQLVSGSAQVSATGPQTALVSGLGVGQNVFRWIVGGEVCPADTDEVLVVREAPVVANAGSDRTLCADSARLKATGAGLWELIAGSGQLADPNDPESWIRQLGQGTTILRWIATSQVCPADSDEVQLTLAVPVDAFAGQDDTVYVPNANLNGNSPGSGTGTWTQIIGTSTIQNPQQASTLAEGLSQGLNRFVWTIENVACETDTKSNGPVPVSKDTVDIYYFQPVVAVAGNDTSLCEGGVYQLQGSSAGQGTGNWTVLSGAGVVSDPANPNANVNGLSLGENLLTWSVLIPGLEASVDTLRLTVQAQPIANAGADQTICTSSANLAANGTGFWSLLSGNAQIANVNQANTALTSISIGENLFTWTVIGGACANAVDTVRIFRQEPISQAQAGQDQQICANETTLGALLPVAGVGTWTLVEGTGTIADPANPQSAITSLNPGVTRLVWSVSGNGCPVSTDTVSIRVDERPVANAGIDQQVCGDSTRLGAITASAGTGFWQSVSSGPLVQSPNTELTDVLDLQPGVNTFRWIVANGVCPSDTDVVVVTSFAAPSQASAGQDRNICGNSAFMEGNAALVGTGLWTVVSGSGTFLNPDSPTSIVTNLGAGTNVFRWTISNTSCTPSSDDVVINSTPAPIADAGPDLVACGGSTTLNATLPPGANGLWIVESGSGVLASPGNPASPFQQMTSPSARLVWVVQSGICTSTDTLVIVNQVNPLTYWPTDSIICSDSVISLNAPFGMDAYLWNDGSTGANLLVDTAGLYWVQITTQQACVFRDSIQVNEIDCSTSINPVALKEFSLKVHPNPGQGRFVVQFKEKGQVIHSGNVRITNQWGQVVWTENGFQLDDTSETELNISHLPNGVYYLEIRSQNHRFREKLVLVK